MFSTQGKTRKVDDLRQALNEWLQDSKQSKRMPRAEVVAVLKSKIQRLKAAWAIALRGTTIASNTY